MKEGIERSDVPVAERQHLPHVLVDYVQTRLRLTIQPRTLQKVAPSSPRGSERPASYRLAISCRKEITAASKASVASMLTMCPAPRTVTFSARGSFAAMTSAARR